MTDNLPPLPETKRGMFGFDGRPATPVYTAEQMQAYARAAIAANAPAVPDAQAQSSMPAGWKLVLVEPNRAMRNAAIKEQVLHRNAGLSLDGDEPAVVIYRAMLAASPQPQPVQPVVAYLDPKDLNELQCCNGMRVWAESPMVHDSPNATSASHLVAVYKASKPEQPDHPEQDLAVAQPERVPLTETQKNAMWVCVRRSLGGGEPEDYYMQGIADAESEHSITKKD